MNFWGRTSRITIFFWSEAKVAKGFDPESQWMRDSMGWDDMGYPLEIPKKIYGQWQGIRATSINGDILCPILWDISGIHYIRSNILGVWKLGIDPKIFCNSEHVMNNPCYKFSSG
jgi:hypothetical protein